MKRTSLILPRRAVLARLSLGAGAVALTPFLRSLEAQAQTVARKRLLLVLQGNGMDYDHIRPREFAPNGYLAKESGRQNAAYIDRSFVNRTDWSQLPPMLEALKGYRERMLIVDGLGNKQNSLPGTSAEHSNGFSALTCVPNAGEKGERSPPGGQSFDQYLAESMGRAAVFRSVDLGVEPISYPRAAYAADRPVPPVTSPQDALMRYFAGPAVTNDAGARIFFTKQQRLYDFLRDDIRRVQTVLAGAERAKLDEYLDSIARLEKRMQTVRQVGTTCTSTGPAVATGAAIEDNIDAMMAVATEALACGLTQVATVTIVDGAGVGPGVWRKLGFTGDNHSLAHGNGEGMVGVDRTFNFVAALIARSLDRLDRTPDVGGSVGKNTLVLWMSDNGAIHHSAHARANAVLIADPALGLRTDGRYLKYPVPYGPSSNFPHGFPQLYDSPQCHSLGELFNSIAHAMGAPTDSFGKGGKEPSRGVLPEVMR